MRASKPVLWLSAVVGALATIAAGAGVFMQAGVGQLTIQSVHGPQVELYGRGLYFRDSVFTGAAFQGTDVVTLLLGLPLLAAALAWQRREPLKGSLLLAGALAYFLYVYATMALAATYNELFLLYVALFGTSFFAFALLMVQLMTTPVRIARHLPNRNLGIFLLLAGALTAVVWLEAPVQTLVAGRPPRLIGAYTTLVTHAIDLAIVVPAVLLAATMILRRRVHGYILAFPLLTLLALLLPLIVAQTIFQLGAGITFTTPEIVGPIGGFVVFGGAAAWIVGVLLRSLALRTSPAAPVVRHRRPATPKRAPAG